MNLFVLPFQSAPAAENMARDLLLLEAFAGPDAPRLRAYGWSQPAWTFGYGQKWDEAQAAAGPDGELVRRATGGGLVDHRADWTYALVLPAAHPLARAGARESYRIVHEALAKAMLALGCGACGLAGAKASQARSLPGNCFVAPEPLDVVRTDDGRKIAGAAQKRTRAGLLLQGSVSRAAAPEVADWTALPAVFAERLGEALGADWESWPGRAGGESELRLATARFASAAWNRRR